MTSVLTALSALLWWVLYSSIAALVCALIATAVLRWSERCGVVFNRVYLACLLWSLIGLALTGAIAAHQGQLRPPYAALVQSTGLRVALVVDMVCGTLLLWRLTPRVDARRIRLGSACLAAAVVIGVVFGVATSLV